MKTFREFNENSTLDFLLDSLLEARSRIKNRMDCTTPDTENGFCSLSDSQEGIYAASDCDEQVNLYLAGLLYRCMQQRYITAKTEFFIPYRFDMLRFEEETASPNFLFTVYQTSGDFIMVRYGFLMGCRTPAGHCVTGRLGRRAEPMRAKDFLKNAGLFYRKAYLTGVGNKRLRDDAVSCGVLGEDPLFYGRLLRQTMQVMGER